MTHYIYDHHRDIASRKDASVTHCPQAVGPIRAIIYGQSPKVYFLEELPPMRAAKHHCSLRPSSLLAEETTLMVVELWFANES